MVLEELQQTPFVLATVPEYCGQHTHTRTHIHARSHTCTHAYTHTHTHTHTHPNINLMLDVGYDGRIRSPSLMNEKHPKK